MTTSLPDFHLQRLTVFVIHLGAAFRSEHEAGGRLATSDTGLMLVALVILIHRRRARRQQRHAAGGNGFIWSIIFIIRYRNGVGTATVAVSGSFSFVPRTKKIGLKNFQVSNPESPGGMRGPVAPLTYWPENV